MSGLATVHGIVVRDLIRSVRQRSRILAGIARPFIWVLLVAAGFSSITRLEGGVPYHAFAYPGGIVMGALFGGTIGAVIEMVSEGGRRDSGLGFFVGSAMGAPFGLVGAYAIDLSLLSFSEEEPLSRRPPVSLLPLVRIDGERTVMGLAGTF